MLIRNEQISALEQVRSDQFEQRMLTYLRSQFPQRLADTSEIQLLALIRQGVRKARRYNVLRDFDVRRFLEFVVQYGSDFDKLDWAWPTLVPPADGTEKMDNLDGIVTFALRS